LNTLASLAGSLFVRSYERSDRIYRAMILRGYGHAQTAYDEFKAALPDLMATGMVCIVAAGFVMAELFLRGVWGG
jgi:cobalt/nickel transport system permease protein